MKRNQRGNMLVLSSVFIAVNALGIVVASSYGSLFFVHNRLQATADELALEGAKKLNEQDRIGQMNNMIARSRQLVYDADDSNQDVQEHLNHLSEISGILHDEAREGASLLENERTKLLNISKLEATSAVVNRYNEIKSGHGLVLPWLQADAPVHPVIKFGCTDKTDSNAAELSGIDELDTKDKDQGIITTDGSKLYKKNIDAKLSTGNDTDLHFHLSSLPAPVQNSISPARVILAKNFKDAPDTQLPSTVQVEMKMDVDTKLGAEAHSTMQCVGTAETNGGQKVM